VVWSHVVPLLPVSEQAHAVQPLNPVTTFPGEALPGVHVAVVVPLTVPAYPAAHVMVAACTLACVSMVLLVVYPVGSVQKVA